MSFDEYVGSGSFGSGSFQNLGYDINEVLNDPSDDRPRIVLMGLRRSGKTSIEKVVFHKMSPHETLFLEPTNDIRIKDIANNSLVQFQILDFPGSYVFDDKSKVDPAILFRRAGALLYVIDGQVNPDDEKFTEAIEDFLKLAKVAYNHNPRVHFDILINKVDGDAYVSDDNKMDTQREIQQQISDELAEAQLPIHPSFYLTSIYDHTVFEAFSKIVQKLIPQLGFLENLLDSLILTCQIEKAFLFDVLSKIYVATDSNPVDMQTYELCSDMIDVVIDVSCIYGLKGNEMGGADLDSTAVIKLSNDYVLYLREVNKCLALVCLMRKASFAKSGVVEYNVATFKKAIAELVDAKEKFRRA